jgi:hypothetical protein
MTPSVPVSPRSVAPRHQSDSEAGHTAFREARHTEGLPYLSTGLPGVPMLQTLPPHCYSTGRFHTTTSPSSSRPHRPIWTSFNVSRLHILPHCSRLLHSMARSHPHPGHHSRNHGTCPLDRLDIPFRLPTDHHHRPGTSVWVTTLPLPGQIMRNPTFSNDRLSPAANGLVKSFHRTLRAAIMCHANQLPFILLGIRTSFKADLQASVTELVYGEPLRIPSELLTPNAHPVEPAHLITRLLQQMARLKPVLATHHNNPGTFIHKDLLDHTHVPVTGLNLSDPRASLQWPLPGLVSERQNTKTHRVLQTHHHVCWQGQACSHIFDEDDSGHTTSKPAATATPTTTPSDIRTPPSTTKTTRSGRHPHFPVRFTT